MSTLSESEKIRIEDNIINNIKNLFRLRKEIDNSATKDIRNLFRLKKVNETIKDKIIVDIKTNFADEDDYYKPVKVGNIWSNNYIEYESDGDKNQNL